MRVISRKRLKEFEERFPDAAGPLDDWYRMLKQKSYGDSHEVRRDFGSASFLGGGRTVFNIGGNKYRLVVEMRYDLSIVFIQKVLTHAEYDERMKRGTL
jgi:mRNA interferase HigB